MGSFYCPWDFLVRTKWARQSIYISDAKNGSLRWILLREFYFLFLVFFFQIDVRKLNRIRAGAARWSKSRSVHYFYLRLSCLVFLLVFYRGEKKRKIGYKVFVWDGLTKAACSFDQRYPAGYLSSYPPALLSHSPSAQLFSSLPIVSSLAYLISSVTG